MKLLGAFILILLLSFAPRTFAQTTEAPELAQSRQLNSQVMQLFAEGKYDEALPIAKRALELREKAFGPVHEELWPLLMNLGEISRMKKQWHEAQAYFQRALEIAAKTHPDSDIQIAPVLDKLGYVAYEGGHETEAVKFFQRSLDIKDKNIGSESPEAASTALNLGEIYKGRRDFQAAKPLYERIVRVREKSPGEHNKELIKALENYLEILLALKDTAGAESVRDRLDQMLVTEGVIQGGVLNGKAIRLVTPEYPLAARMDRARGIVRVRVLIDEQGKVSQALAISSGALHPALIHAAENAARQSEFTPTVIAGKPVKVIGTIIYRFVAQ